MRDNAVGDVLLPSKKTRFDFSLYTRTGDVLGTIRDQSGTIREKFFASGDPACP
jgi:hypothetical protein